MSIMLVLSSAKLSNALGSDCFGLLVALDVLKFQLLRIIGWMRSFGLLEVLGWLKGLLKISLLKKLGLSRRFCQMLVFSRLLNFLGLLKVSGLLTTLYVLKITELSWRAREVTLQVSRTCDISSLGSSSRFDIQVGPTEHHTDNKDCQSHTSHNAQVYLRRNSNSPGIDA